MTAQQSGAAQAKGAQPNQAFSNIGKAAPLSSASKLPTAIAVILIVLLAAAAYVAFMPKGAQVPPQNGLAVNNSTQLPPQGEQNISGNQTPALPEEVPVPANPSPDDQTDGQPVLPVVPGGPSAPADPVVIYEPAPIPEPPVVAVPEPVATPAPEPAVPAPTPEPVAPTPAPEPAVSPTPSANASNSSNQSLTHDDYSSQYRVIFRRYSTGGLAPGAFCIARDLGNFVQLHYKMYYGADCVTEKPDQGAFTGFEAFKADKCEFVPCCIKGPLGEYSKGYDFIECGKE